MQFRWSTMRVTTDTRSVTPHTLYVRTVGGILGPRPPGARVSGRMWHLHGNARLQR